MAARCGARHGTDTDPAGWSASCCPAAHSWLRPAAVRPVCTYPPSSHSTTPYTTLAAVPNTITGPAIRNILAAMPVIRPSACVKIGHIIFLLFSNFTIQSNCNQLFLLKGASSGQLSNCFYDFLGEIIMTPEINLYSSIFIDTDLLYQFPKFFWAVLIQKLNTLGICF